MHYITARSSLEQKLQPLTAITGTSLPSPLPEDSICLPEPYVSRLVNSAKNEQQARQVERMLWPVKESGAPFAASNGQKLTVVDVQKPVRSSLKGFTQLYHDRALVSPCGKCLMRCPWCFRTPQSGCLTDEELSQIVDKIKNDRRINDVILTGGEPFLFDRRRLFSLLTKLRRIQHVSIIRFHTRAPVVVPGIFDQEMLEHIGECCQRHKPVYVVTQVVHPCELSEEVAGAVFQLSKTGCTVLNQAPMLCGVNDDEDTFTVWHQRMIQCGIKPYYAIVPIIRPGWNNRFYVEYEEVAKLVAKYSSSHDGLGRPTIIMPIMGRKYIPLDLENQMVKFRGIHFRMTKTEIWS